MANDVLTRTFTLRAAPPSVDGAGRIVEARCVPYNVPTKVRDSPDGPEYVEVFRPGAFARACRAADRVHFKFRHGEGISDFIGRGVAFTETETELAGSFRVLASPFGDHALALVDEGVMAGVSVGFVPLGREKRTPEGHYIRDRCHLAEVSLVPVPAYEGAAVTGRREAVPLPLVLRDETLSERLRAVGVRL